MSPDATPPTLVDWSPTEGEVNLPTAPLMRLHFDEAMSADSVTSSTFVLTDSTDTIIDTFAVLMDEDTVALRNLNAAIHGDDRVSVVMLPVGDGTTLCRKR